MTVLQRLRRPALRPVLLAAAWCALAVPALAQSPTMRERIYDRLSKAQAAADGGDYAKALELLREVEKTKDLSPYETAQLHTAFGFLEYSRENYKEAIAHYEKVVAQEGLPEAMASLTLYTLAQLQFVVEDYQAAADGINRWLAKAEAPGPEPYVLLAQAYYKLGRYRDGLAPVERAIRIAETSGRDIQEQWYLLLRVLHYELRDWPKVIEVLETLVAKFPKKEYWVQLAASYGEVDDAPNRLASYDAAYLQGFLDTQTDVVVYTQLLLQAGVPYRGAIVLEKGMADRVVERSERHLQLLSEAWTLAREEDRAIEVLGQAAELTSDGKADARLARLHLNREEADEAIAACQRALKKGVEDPGEIRCVEGMALFELDRFEDAKAAFRKALSSPDSKDTATQWIGFIEREQERLARLQIGQS